MTYSLRTKKQYWIEIWEGRKKIGALSRGGSYQWFIWINDQDQLPLTGRSYDNLALAKAALDRYMKRRHKKNKDRL